jgi:uncharacterized protein YjbI with pentapeptide repeats
MALTSRYADLGYANLNNADLGNVNLGGTDLEGITWNEDTYWEDVRGLETARNVPIALKQQLGLE